MTTTEWKAKDVERLKATLTSYGERSLPTEASKNLRDAAAHIDYYGHCKGRYHSGEDYQSPCCLLGSLHAIRAKFQSYDVVYNFLGTSSVSTWNDEPERTKEEVTALLRQAADWVEEVFQVKL